MIVLALLLLLIVVGLVVFVLLTGVDQTVQLSADWLNMQWEPSVLWVFLLGALALFLAEIALAMLRSGTRRKVERRRELKRLRERAATPAYAGAAPGAAAGAAAGAAQTEPAQSEPARTEPAQAHPAQTRPADAASGETTYQPQPSRYPQTPDDPDHPGTGATDDQQRREPHSTDRPSSDAHATDQRSTWHDDPSRGKHASP